MNFSKIFYSALAFAVIAIATPAIAQDKGKTTAISKEDMELYRDGINPADMDVDHGETLFSKVDGKEGKACASCHTGAKPMGGNLDGVASTFPKFNKGAGHVITVEDQINICRTAMKAKVFKYNKGDMNGLALYVRSLSVGAPVNVKTDGPAGPTYALGEKVFSTRRGQRNVACATCHVELAGSTIRMQPLKEIGGAASHWPAYRMKNGQTTSFQRRFQQCMKNARMVFFELGDYRMNALELYVTALANGHPLDTPGWVR